MNLIIVAVLLLLSIENASSFSNGIIIRKIYSKFNAIPDRINDSSELEFESSSSIKERREKNRLLQIEQENNIRSLQKASRELLLKIEMANKNSKPTPIATIEPAKEASTSTSAVSITAVSTTAVSTTAVSTTAVSTTAVSSSLVSSESKAFDAGLLIAFPFIVATLGLFLFFPFLRDNLTTSLPPLPSIEEMMKN